MTKNELIYLGIYFLAGIAPIFVIIVIAEIAIDFLFNGEISIDFPAAMHRSLMITNILGFITILNKEKSRPFYLKKEESITPRINLFMNIQLYLFCFIILLLAFDRLSFILTGQAAVTDGKSGILIFDCLLILIFSYVIFYKHTKSREFQK